MTEFLPVIVAGGEGLRLWPLSRRYFPKQFTSLDGGSSLLVCTLQRIREFAGGCAAPVMVCNEAHRFLTAEACRSSGISPARILLEPEGRNTAPALTAAALFARKMGNDPVMVVLPADHLIADDQAFRAGLKLAVRVVAGGDAWIGTLGIRPERPETGYGYLETGEPIGAGDENVFRLSRFAEKPDPDTARAYLESGGHLWNSGIFVVRASVWLEAIRCLHPGIHGACCRAIDAAVTDGDFLRLDPDAFRACPADSIDYAVMERLSELPGTEAVVVPVDCGWSDAGSWDTVWQARQRDNAGNAFAGDVLALETYGSFVHADHRFVATLGVRDLAVVETADAVLVADRHRSQELKSLVAKLEEKGRDEHLVHRRVHRPWGCYETVDRGERFQVKRLTVYPGSRLSLQMHRYRTEHWVVVRGLARVTRDGEVFDLDENESTFIPAGMKHRLENPGDYPLEIIEVQSGDYLGEDDIIRFDDDFGR
ncbi:MAG: mannose-1-phosphate guanylyltransferase/mannose-6-phosphate isomerase [Gammaproteobacteria bacterium]|nr:mannose-1-phosphate guanylyltransferase/mannose-6-phosphate isomerase [Gammaproteobacteria bacterium]